MSATQEKLSNSGLSPAEMNRVLKAENARWPMHLIDMPTDQIMSAVAAVHAAKQGMPSFGRIYHAMRSKDFLVQFRSIHEHKMIVLSVCRTTLDDTGHFKADISWDDLQRLKREAGFGDTDAVEIYPRDADLTNVGNMRHIWIYSHVPPPPFIWRKGE